MCALHVCDYMRPCASGVLVQHCIHAVRYLRPLAYGTRLWIRAGAYHTCHIRDTDDVVCLSRFCSDNDPWLLTSEGKVSVARAVRRGLKVNHRGQAVEARTENVVCHILVHHCDVVAMAIVLGMPPPTGYAGESRIVCANDKTTAMRFVIDKVWEGVRVTLIPKERNAKSVGAFYLHNSGSLKARFVPETIMLTRNVGMRPGNQWTASVFKKNGCAAHIGGGAVWRLLDLRGIEPRFVTNRLQPTS